MTTTKQTTTPTTPIPSTKVRDRHLKDVAMAAAEWMIIAAHQPTKEGYEDAMRQATNRIELAQELLDQYPADTKVRKVHKPTALRKMAGRNGDHVIGAMCATYNLCLTLDYKHGN